MTIEDFTNDELLALLHERGLTSMQWTLRAFVEDWLARLPSKRTRDTYRTYAKRLCDGVGPVCESTTCEPCLVGPDFRCACTCATCTSSRLEIEAQADRPLSVDVLSERNATALVRIARRMAVKKGILDNRSRAKRGLPARTLPGLGAEKSCVHALRSLYKAAGKELHAEVSGAAGIPMPGLPPGRRRALHDFELIELYEVAVGRGREPQLDELLFDTGLMTGMRREGTYLATVGAVHPETQILMVCDKYSIPTPMPVSADLCERLLAHAIERGGEECDPKSPWFCPDKPLFYYKEPNRDGSPHALTDKHFEALHNGWHRLSWAAEVGVTFHWLRHTMSEQLKRDYGQHYAKRFLRHNDKSVTDKYGECTLEQLAAAIGEIFGFEHPLATERTQRRAEVLGRYGIETGV